MIRWQQLKYGTLVLGGLALTGLTLYYDLSRRTVAPEDMAELLEAARERYYPFLTAAATARVVRCWTPVWGPDGTTNRYVAYVAGEWQGTNWVTTPVYTNYLALLGSNEFCVTNWEAAGGPALPSLPQRFSLHVGRSLVSGEEQTVIWYETQSWAMAQGPRAALAGAIDGAIFDLIPRYLNPTNPLTTNMDLNYLTASGLFADLGIGTNETQTWVYTNESEEVIVTTTVVARFTRTPAANDAARTNWVYHYMTWFPSSGAPHELHYTAEAQRAVNYASAWDGSNYTWAVYSNAAPASRVASNRPATYGDVPIEIYRADWLERYRVFQALRVAPHGCQWSAGGQTNLDVGWGERQAYFGDPTNGFDDEVRQIASMQYLTNWPPWAGAETWVPTAPLVGDVAPAELTALWWVYETDEFEIERWAYRALIHVRAARVQGVYGTPAAADIPHEITFYVYATNSLSVLPVGGGFANGLNMYWSGLAPGWNQLAAITGATDQVQSPYFPPIAMTMPDQPPDSGQLGWRATESRCVIEWTFERCPP